MIASIFHDLAMPHETSIALLVGVDDSKTSFFTIFSLNLHLK